MNQSIRGHGLAVQPQQADASLTDPQAAIRRVDDLLRDELNRLSHEWGDIAAGMSIDVLPIDLPSWLGSLLVGRGKRFRVIMSHWGLVAAGGARNEASLSLMERAAAALEALHLFALVHDDVMDESTTRRGRSAAHVEAEQWHRQAAAIGDGEVFGRSLAILLGDLSHTVADRLASELTPTMRRTWFEMCIELMVGQRGDLTGAAAARADRTHAEKVARLKSGRYTVQRPLQLGAQAADASTETIDVLLRFGGHLGQAFALRDDYLGVWGRPEHTGKPAGDDLLEAKPTVLLSMARERLTGGGAAALRRLGTPEARPGDVELLTLALQEAGLDVELERLINREYAAALAALDHGGLDPAGIAGLRAAAHSVAWRTT